MMNSEIGADTFQGYIENLARETLQKTGAAVIALYRRDSIDGYEPVFWVSDQSENVPAYIASGSDLSAYLRSHTSKVFTIGAAQFRDNLLRHAFASYGIDQLVVMPLEVEPLGWYYMTAGFLGSQNPNTGILFDCAARIGRSLTKASLQARIRGRAYPIERRGVAGSGAGALSNIAVLGADPQSIAEKALGLLGDSARSILIEDENGLLMGVSPVGINALTMKQRMTSLSRLPYLDILDRTSQPVLVPSGPSESESLVCPLVADGQRRGFATIELSPGADAEVCAGILGDLILALLFLICKEDASRTSVLQKMLGSVENERARVAIQLHDDTSQNLVALKVYLATVRTALAQGRFDEAQGILDDCERVADGLLDDVNRLSSELRSSELVYLGFKDAVESSARTQLGKTGVGYSFAGNSLDVRFGALQGSMLLKGVAEAISNCSRHAHASHVAITMEDDGMWFTVTIADDGCGFTPGEKTDAGSGMKAMRDCAEAIGGTFWISSTVGTGTMIRFGIPHRALEVVDDE